jgi:polysaccharide biosynthesis transport protein
MTTDQLDFRAVLGLARRQAKLISSIVALALLMAVLALAVLSPVYTATALLIVEPRGTDVLARENATSNPATENARIDGEVEIVQSEAVLLQVIEDGELLSDTEFGQRLGLIDRATALFSAAQLDAAPRTDLVQRTLRQLRGALRVERRGMTYLIAISIRSADPEKAATIANLVADVYISNQIARKVDAVVASQTVLDGMLAETRRVVVASETALDTFIDEYLNELEQSGVQVQATFLRYQLDEMQSQREAILDRANQINQALADTNYSSLLDNIDQAEAAQLRTRRAEIQENLEQIPRGGSAAIDLAAELAALDTQIAALGRTTVAGLLDQASSLRQQSSPIEDEIRTSIFRSELPVDALATAYELQQAAELARTQYQSLLERSSNLRLEAQVQLADARVISPATPPLQPSFPNTLILLAGSIFLGLAGGAGAAFLREMFIGGVTSSEQAMSIFKPQAVIEVPRLTTPGTTLSEQVMTMPISVYSESIRRIRASLDQQLKRHGSRNEVSAPQRAPVILITSAIASEGKSTLSLALARVYALAGRKTLLVDCDLRRPSIHREIKQHSDQGLLDYLAGAGPNVDLEKYLHLDESGLCILTGASPSETATDQLLTSAKFERFLETARKDFEYVILDSPPLDPVVDTLYLAQHADAAVFVIHWASTPQLEAKRAFDQLQSAMPTNTFRLLVLNQLQTALGKQRHYGQYFDPA